MVSGWEKRLNELRSQIEQMKVVLDDQLQLERSHRSELEKATTDLKRTLMVQAPDAEANSIAQLSRLLQNVSATQLAGTLVVGADGKFLLFSAITERLLGAISPNDAAEQLQPGTRFFFTDKATECPRSELPWVRVLSGVDVPESKLFVVRPDIHADGIWIRVSGTPVMGPDGKTGGGVLFIADATELTHVEEQIRRLVAKFEAQISTIENSYNALRELADRLGPKGTVASAPPATVASQPDMVALVVDDIPVNQKLLILQLRKLNLQIEVANNGKEAVDAVHRKHFDIVFMDVDMPVMDGLQATQAIRAAEKQTGKHVPIVAMTSFDRDGDRDRCLASGMDEYLVKGVNQQAIRDVIEKLPARLATTNRVESASEFDALEEDVLDVAALTEMYGEAEVEEILRLFQACSRTLVSCLEFAIEEHDMAAVNHMAYSLKGPCASLRLRKSTQLTVDICKQCEAGGWGQAKELYADLRSQMSRIREQLANTQFDLVAFA